MSNHRRHFRRQRPRPFYKPTAYERRRAAQQSSDAPFIRARTRAYQVEVAIALTILVTLALIAWRVL